MHIRGCPELSRSCVIQSKLQTALEIMLLVLLVMYMCLINAVTHCLHRGPWQSNTQISFYRAAYGLLECPGGEAKSGAAACMCRQITVYVQQGKHRQLDTMGSAVLTALRGGLSLQLVEALQLLARLQALTTTSSAAGAQLPAEITAAAAGALKTRAVREPATSSCACMSHS